MKKWWKDPIQKSIVAAKISDSVKRMNDLRPVKKLTFKSVFLGKYKKEESGCWIWQKSKDQKGYGRIQSKGKKWSAHRLSFTLSKGNILKGMSVCHSCDNPPCINPDHLWLGTMGDNMLDMMKKGRGRISKLSDEDKIKIKTMAGAGYSQEDIARQFDTSLNVVRFIVS